MKLSDYVRLLVLAAIWGASFLFMRISAPVLGALPTAFFRVLLGAIGLAVILAILKTKVDFKGKLKAIMVLGVINSGIPFLMYSVAALLLPAGYSAIFNATTPLMGVMIGWMCFSDSLTLKKAAGVLIGLMGITWLTSTGPVTLSMGVVMGALACLVATSCYGAAGFLTKRWVADKGGLDAKLVAFGSQMGATLFLAPFFGISAAISPPATWSLRQRRRGAPPLYPQQRPAGLFRLYRRLRRLAVTDRRRAAVYPRPLPAPAGPGRGAAVVVQRQ